MPLRAAARSLASVVTASLLAAFLLAASFWIFVRINSAASARRQTYQFIVKAEGLLGELGDAETGQRGFVLTGDEAFLQPYLAVRDDVPRRLAELRSTTQSKAAQAPLEALAPLVEAKLADMATAIELRRGHHLDAALVKVREGEGKHLMDAIRSEMSGLIRVEEELVARHEAEFQSRMAILFVLLVGVSLFALVVAVVFIRVVRHRTQQRIRDLVHLETQHLLGQQETTNERLRLANANLLESEAKLAVTLHSIGDAVIATDAQARIQLMNPVAEQLTGWRLAEAQGSPMNLVFRIISQVTRQPMEAPILDTLAHGTVQGLANHTLLIARDGSECAISDSCAPIRDAAQQVVGAVLVFRDVTREYAAQEALKDSNAMIQAIIGTVADGIITILAADGRIVTVNPAALRMFGYAGPELIGQSLEKLVPGLEWTQLHGYRDLVQATAEARDFGLGREVEGRRKNGQGFPLEVVFSGMWLSGQRYYTGVLRDISARKLAEAALAQAGALHAAIFKSASFSCIATDSRGVIQIFNVGAERMLGYAASEVMDKITPADISDPEEVITRAQALSLELGTVIAPGFEALAFKASRGIEDIYELTYLRKDGTRLPALVSVTALRDAHESIIGDLLIGTDNTARLQVESERTRLDQALQDNNAELMSARITADKANLAKSEFLSSMSHELRSPLNAILGFAQLMDSATPPATPPQKASIDRILHAGWYLLELINEILDLAVIESGKLSLSEEPVSLSEVMLDCQSIMEPQSLKRGIRLTFPVFAAPAFVRADRVRLKQVLINLLSNAIKYNRPGGTVVVACTTEIQGRVRISVRDTGHGLSSDQLRQLFQPFNRLGQERSSEEGTGIGLVMSKLLVELMGGAIGVDSKVGTGSVFWYDLDALAAPEIVGLDTGFLESAPVLEAMPEVVRTVLYIEDNPANMDLVTQLIARRRDLRMLGAGDALRGLELARDQHPDVILMDINLPGLSGLEALTLLKADPTTAPIPVIAISANAMVGDIRKGLEAGFFSYLTKPIKVTVFMEALNEALASAGDALASST